MDNLQNNEEQKEKKEVVISFSIKDVFLLMLIGLMITNVWQCLEWIMYQEVRGSAIDTIVALVLTYSIFLNIKLRKIRKKQ